MRFRSGNLNLTRKLEKYFLNLRLMTKTEYGVRLHQKNKYKHNESY